MSDMMTFPETWEEFDKSYGFDDSEEVYTNGSRLIPSFRVKQWLDHIAQFKTKQQATVSSDCISRQDAKDVIDMELDAIDHVPEWVYDRLLTALDKAPSAQPEPCKDAVSREAVSEWLKQYGQDVLHGKYKFSLMYIWKNLMALPPAQPKIGRWIKVDMHRGMADHKCTACEQECYVPTCMGEPMYAFCPNCGADMREGDSE